MLAVHTIIVVIIAATVIVVVVEIAGYKASNNCIEFLEYHDFPSTCQP